ncbi:S41 family peptidase [Novipirellula sp.]|uniref:S41 family peptidase n=1 Tax=Novipirellula sp. TaxID=2795430 RepID=UPI0035624364
MNRIPQVYRRQSAGTFFSLIAAALLLGYASPASAQVVTEAEQFSVTPEQQAVQQGLELEQARLWADAVRHYEDASKKHPGSKSLYQRLTIAKLHYDVNRRYQDTSYLQSVDRLSQEQALDLYAEILANLQTHYVEQIDWARVMLHGTAALEVALTEEKFVSRMLATADPVAVENFRQNVHHQLANRSTATRFDLRANVAFVASLAQSEIGLSPTATALEFMSGAVSTLDPYTRLLSGNQLDEMFSNIEGNFVGLGIELKAESNALHILSVIPGGPAEEAGLIGGDRIIRVEATETKTSDPGYAADLLRGPEKSYVSIGVLGADGNVRDLKVQRRRVEVPCVENVHIVDAANHVGYLRLTNFQKTTTRDIEQALWDLHRQGMKSLILDVRGNPGGLLSAAVEVADRFLGDGRIVTTRGRNARENYDYTAHRPNTWNIPLAVLIDRDSASASEIFAGAIADSGRGDVIGETSYGKGSVQGIFRMQSAKFGLCLTTAKFYSPSGRAISLNGVTPSVPVEPTYIAARPNSNGEMTTDREDAVLQRAISRLSDNNWISRRPQ